MTYSAGRQQRVLMRQYDFWGTLTDKECGKCDAVLPVVLFSNAFDNSDGLANWCTPCKVRYNKNTCRFTKRSHNLKQKYDMTPDAWEKLFEEQGRCCAACGSTESGSVRGWATDHEHGTKRVRGILCQGCNVAIGNLNDDPERAIKLAAYLRK